MVLLVALIVVMASTAASPRNINSRHDLPSSLFMLNYDKHSNDEHLNWFNARNQWWWSNQNKPSTTQATTTPTTTTTTTIPTTAKSPPVTTTETTPIPSTTLAIPPSTTAEPTTIETTTAETTAIPSTTLAIPPSTTAETTIENTTAETTAIPSTTLAIPPSTTAETTAIPSTTLAIPPSTTAEPTTIETTTAETTAIDMTTTTLPPPTTKKVIFSGVEVVEGQFPSVVWITKSYPNSRLNVRAQQQEGEDYSYEYEYDSKDQDDVEYIRGDICGGTLISARYVLTTADCLLAPEGYYYNTYYVNISNSVGIPALIDYYSQKNIALLKLTKSVKLTSTVYPPCLPKRGRHSSGDESAIAVGWTPKNQLVGSSYDIYPNSRCKGSEKFGDELGCAGMAGGQRKLCSKGYKGGPLLVENSNYSTNTRRQSECRYWLVGIITDGPMQCGGRDEPDTFTRIEPFVDWIEGIIHK